MTNSMDTLTIVLLVIAGIMIALLVVLAIVYMKMKLGENKRQENEYKKEDSKGTKKDDAKKGIKQYTVESVFDFMEFDKIEDNMIIQNNGKKYIMIIECQGINYDLMSEEEKVSVEEGFLQFLNTLTGPIQIYTQTRKINLESSLQNYNEKLSGVENNYTKQKIRYEQLQKNPNVTDEILKNEYYELVKQRNLYEYGKDIIYNTERMSLNRNILNKKYYIAISAYTSELLEGNYDTEEEKDRAFSDLYTRSQSIIRALSTTGVMGRILSSTDLADLLYVAYNRDEAEEYGIDKAMKAKYDELYVTAPDYMDQKIKLLDEEIDREAYKKANEKIAEAQTEKQKKYKEKKENIDDIIKELAKLYISENSKLIGKDIAEEATKKLKEEGKARKEKQEDVQKKNSGTRKVASRT